jgi:hypothetical protein
MHFDSLGHPRLHFCRAVIQEAQIFRMQRNPHRAGRAHSRQHLGHNFVATDLVPVDGPADD